MEYNIEKINAIGKMLAEVIGEAMTQREEEQVRIGDVEMALRETLRAVGQSGLKHFLEKVDSELEAEIECACGGKLQYQRRRAATIWSVFGKVVYKRAYYAGCDCQTGQAPVDNHYGIEAGKMTAGMAFIVFALQMMVLYIPALANFFEVVPLSLCDLSIAAAAGVIVFVAMEVSKKVSKQ